jgi:hypothetical protein
METSTQVGLTEAKRFSRKPKRSRDTRKRFSLVLNENELRRRTTRNARPAWDLWRTVLLEAQLAIPPPKGDRYRLCCFSIHERVSQVPQADGPTYTAPVFGFGQVRVAPEMVRMGLSIAPQSLLFPDDRRVDVCAPRGADELSIRGTVRRPRVLSKTGSAVNDEGSAQ